MGGIIAGVVCPSTLDFYGYSALVVFFAGCNLNCSYCFNHKIIKMHGKHYSTKQLEKLVKQNKKCCDAIVLSGGEPTLQDQTCIELFEIARKYELTTMLNTNLTQPMVILDLVERGLVDKIAADVKAPLHSLEYAETCGIKDAYLYSSIACTLQLIKKLDVDIELRTTSMKDSYSYGKYLYKLIDQITPLTSEWHLQQLDDTNTLDPKCKGRVPTREELLPYAQYAKFKGIPKVVLKTKLGGYEEI
jgi:pyruvate formate lyase activating enzyme